MSREIKFRGLRTDGKGWVIGGVVYGKSGNVYIFQGNDIEIVEDDCLEVIPETVGQFTGLHDKNGKEIYEGDILEHYCCYHNHLISQKVSFGWHYTDNDGRHHEYVMGWVDEDGCPIDTNENEYKIIGSIHENE